VDIKCANGVTFDRADPQLIKLARVFYDKAVNELKIPIIFTSVDRLLTTQIVLFCQGRMALADVNKIRKRLGLYLLDSSDDNEVTWTLDSRHVVDNNKPFSTAFDIAVLKNGSANWNDKVNVNGNDVPDYIELAKMGQSIGLEPGALWTNVKPDMPHFQLPKIG
jgi:hypothetical protein